MLCSASVAALSYSSSNKKKTLLRYVTENPAPSVAHCDSHTTCTLLYPMCTPCSLFSTQYGLASLNNLRCRQLAVVLRKLAGMMRVDRWWPIRRQQIAFGKLPTSRTTHASIFAPIFPNARACIRPCQFRHCPPRKRLGFGERWLIVPRCRRRRRDTNTCKGCGWRRLCCPKQQQQRLTRPHPPPTADSAVAAVPMAGAQQDAAAVNKAEHCPVVVAAAIGHQTC